ncbi:pro-Pol polyprotein [Trichonephila clavipes]|nr:pro-Pol polyprotein [Trichonephila clavipes]
MQTELINQQKVWEKRRIPKSYSKRGRAIKHLSCRFHWTFAVYQQKIYQHILTIIDAFTKFIWLYPIKSTTLEDALDKLKLQQKTFGNPKRMITDKGSPFNSKGFDDYCTEENIQNLQITGVPRGNGQVWRESTEL